MDNPPRQSVWREKTPDAGSTFFHVDTLEPAFETLLTAMRVEFLNAFAAIEKLRLENHLLRAKLGGCIGTAARHARDIETREDLVPDEGAPMTPSEISLERSCPTLHAKSGVVAATSDGSDRQVRITKMEHEPGNALNSEDCEVDVPVLRLPITPSSLPRLLPASSTPDADEDSYQDAQDVDTFEFTRAVSPMTHASSLRSLDSKVSLMTLSDVWEGKPKSVLRFRSPSRLLREQPSIDWDGADWDGVRAGDELKEDSAFQPFMLHPWHPQIIIWDAVVGVVSVYDLIMVPLQVFPLADTTMYYAMDLMTAWVWTLDTFASFLRGRDIGGVIDMRPSKIAARYLRTWFVLDFPVAVMDWILVIATTTQLDVVRSIRLRRVLRLIRVTRILRVTKIVRSVRRRRKELPISDYTEACKSVITFLLTMYMVNHYVACGWYAIGNVGTKPNWVAKAFDESDSIAFRYATAYHWSLTQFTPASMEVVPTNVLERAYSVGAIFFGLVMFTSFVSHMTNAVMRIQQLATERVKSRLDVRKYVQDHQVSFDLTKKIEAYVQTANKRMKSMRLLEADITVLRMLPENLLAKLREQVFEPALTVHPFFEKLHVVERSAFVSVCNLATAEKIVLIGEELFRCGQTAIQMYISTAGDLSYFEGFDGYTNEVVPEGSWFSEAALWCKWTHRGRMLSCDDVAEIVTVGAAEFHSIISSTGSFYQVQRYAKEYCTLAVKDCGSKDRIVDTWGGPYWVHKAIHHAWTPSVIGSANTVLSLWLDRGENLYVDAFDAWKTYTKAAVNTRQQNQGCLQRALVAFLPATVRRSLVRAPQSFSRDS